MLDNGLGPEKNARACSASTRVKRIKKTRVEWKRQASKRPVAKAATYPKCTAVVVRGTILVFSNTAVPSKSRPPGTRNAIAVVWRTLTGTFQRTSNELSLSRERGLITRQVPENQSTKQPLADDLIEHQGS